MLANANRKETMVPPPVPHRSVLVAETLSLLAPQRGATVVDLTLGPGGHAEKLLEAVGPDGRVIGIDRDPEAIEHAMARLRRFGDRFVAIRGDYRDLVALLHGARVFAVEAILADLGISSLQLDDPRRGFSFQTDGPLDMRMDPTSGPSAADLLATLSEGEIKEILRTYGEEKFAGPIARAVVRERGRRPLVGTRQLSAVVERAAGASARRYRIHPATRTFQALRIAVNREVEGLEKLAADAVSLLRRGGRLAIISFHSLEDRAVKTAFRAMAERCICPPGLPVCGCGREDLLRILTPRPVTPSPEEIASNPRSRSARLRAAERL
jgi:16S rRNA (cytosine1402-N4)-methyltransferase